MMGLKPGGEFSELEPESSAQNAKTAATVAANDTSESLAAKTQMALGSDDTAESLFLRIRSRYSSLVKLGRL
jgi:hypothetical protein